jgi:hypothetical protein
MLLLGPRILYKQILALNPNAKRRLSYHQPFQKVTRFEKKSKCKKFIGQLQCTTSTGCPRLLCNIFLVLGLAESWTRSLGLIGRPSNHKAMKSSTAWLVSSRPTWGFASICQTTDFYPRIHHPQINAKYCLAMRPLFTTAFYTDKGIQPDSHCCHWQCGQ